MTSRLVQRSCPLCDGSDAAPRLRKGDLTLAECRRCHMTYANPVAPELVNGDFYDQLATPYYLSPDKLQSDYSPVRFERELKLFRRFCRGGRVLDVGCSTGAFLHELRRRFNGDYEAIGVDVAGPALDHAEKNGVPVVREPFLSASFPGTAFSAVTFWAVLEHLAQPRPFLVKAASLLEPGGHCFVLVPNFRSLATRWLGANYRYILPQHVNYFDRTTLTRLCLLDSRFRVVYSGSTHFNPLVLLEDSKRRGGFVSDEERARLLRRTTRGKQHPALKPLKLALAGIERALGAFTLADNLVLVLQKIAA